MAKGKNIRFFFIQHDGIEIIENSDLNLEFEDEVRGVDNTFRRLKDYVHDQGVDGDFTEIERKWILKRIPEGFPLIVDAICEQSYLSISPEVRLRKRAETGNAPLFFLDVKSSGTMERNEITIPISEKEVHSYALLLEGKPVIKKKWHLFDVGNGQTLEVTIVDPGTETEFIYVEVEFRTRREAENFVLPIPDAIEVTDD